MDDSYVPTQAEMWEFLVGFKDATQAGFLRLEAKMDAMALNLDSRLDRVERRLDRVESRLDGVEHRLEIVERRLDGVENRLNHLEAQVAQIVGWNLPRRFDEHEARFAQLERKNG